MRGSGFVPITTNSAPVTWPAGTVAGDMAVVIVSAGWDFTIPAGWTSLGYRSGTGTAVAGSCFYKLLDAADISAGGFTLALGGSAGGGLSIATFQDGADLSVSFLTVNGATGTIANQTVGLGGSAPEDLFLVYGGIEANVAITFATAPGTHSFSAASYSMRFGVYDPSSSGVANDTIGFASASAGAYWASVRISKTAATNGLTVASTAISAASEGTRWAAGALYFEMVITTLAGTVGVGVVNISQTFGAAVLGTGVNNFIYRSSGVVICNGVTLATISPFTGGDRISVAYHPGAGLVWFKVNAGSWNNDGGANPATLTGGIAVSAFVASVIFPACDFSVAGSTVTAVFAAGSFAYTPPTGFYSVEEVGLSVVYNADIGVSPVGTPGDDPGDWCARTDLPQDNQSRAISFPAGPVKVLAGEVQEDSVPVAGKLVRVYNKRTGDYVGEAITDGSGVFSIPAQDPNLPHFVVAFDDPEYNAKVYDNVMPA